MVKRPPGGIFGDAWVFPGGLTEPADGVLEEADLLKKRAAVRERYEAYRNLSPGSTIRLAELKTRS